MKKENITSINKDVFTYKNIFQILQKELNNFLLEEKGNKVTNYSIEGLIHRIMSNFENVGNSNDKLDKK